MFGTTLDQAWDSGFIVFTAMLAFAGWWAFRKINKL
jgi:hypothetical protein